VRADDPAAEGITYPDLRFTVDPDRVAAFARVVGQDGPASRRRS
jgi:hypothetical protein